MTYKKLLYDFLYAIRTFIFRQNLPYMFGIQLNDNCNLNCFYCQGKNKGEIYITYDKASEILKKAYKRGNRSLYITGGEPMLWTDKDKNMSDIVDLAYDIGFFTVLIATNGTHPLIIPKVTYLITVDGPREIHNKIRDNTFDLIIDNLKHLHGSKAFATITITRENYQYIEEFIISITNLGVFKGILFNTLTHQPVMLEKYGFNQSERALILDRIWKLKIEGFPIILSKAAYVAFRNNNWVRPIDQIEISVGDKLFTCCRDIGNKDICLNCGYLGMIEISQVLKLRLSALLEVLKLV